MDFSDLELIYSTLFNADLTESQYDFDRYYLSREDGHYGYLKGGHHSATTDTVFRLFLNLRDLEQNPDISEEQKEVVQKLISYIWLHLLNNTPTGRQTTTYSRRYLADEYKVLDKIAEEKQEIHNY